MSKSYLVWHTSCVGEYGFSQHSLISIEPREHAEAQIHKYFMVFYGDKKNVSEYKKMEFYSYFDGGVTVKDITYRLITSDEVKIFEKLNI